MLRNLILAGLTALSLAAPATSASAGRGGRKPETPVHEVSASAAPDKKVVVKKVVKVRRGAGARRQAGRAQAVLANQGLLRQSWTLAALNPMPALLDLDDTAKSLRRATEQIAQLMTR